MKYYIASDHAGFELKAMLKKWLEKKFKFTDLGVFVPEGANYPELAANLAKRVSKEKGSFGVLICGTGIGMSIVANKVPGVRAALVYDGFTAKMAREHNNANVACLGARTTKLTLAKKMVEIFLTTEFAGNKKDGKRHLKRVEKIMEIEKQNFK